MCAKFHLNELLELQQQDKGEGKFSLVSVVQLRDEYRHANQTLSQCYRLCFDPIVSNAQAKVLEKEVRLDLDRIPIDGMRLA